MCSGDVDANLIRNNFWIMTGVAICWRSSVVDGSCRGTDGRFLPPAGGTFASGRHRGESFQAKVPYIWWGSPSNLAASSINRTINCTWMQTNSHTSHYSDIILYQVRIHITTTHTTRYYRTVWLLCNDPCTRQIRVRSTCDLHASNKFALLTSPVTSNFYFYHP